jgi:hypothetical protein
VIYEFADGDTRPGSSVMVEDGAAGQLVLDFYTQLTGTQDFQRVPDGTKAAVTALTQDGRWLKVRASIIAPGVVHRQLRHGRLPCAPT